MACPKIEEPETYLVDDSLFIFPEPEMKDTPIFRGSQHRRAPAQRADARRSLDGTAMIKVGDKITTDHIMPPASRLKYRSNVPKYAEFVFENVDATFSKRCLENKKQGHAQHHRGRGILRPGLQPRARRHVPDVPGRQGGDRQVLRAHPLGEPGQLRDRCRWSSGTRPTTTASSRATGSSAENWRDAVAEGKPVVLRNERTGGTIECTCALSERSAMRSWRAAC